MSQERIGLSAWVGLASQFLMNTANFMVMPLLAVYLDRHLSFTAGQIGTILTVYLLATRLLPMLSGPAADGLGYLPMMVSGMFVRALGFAGFLVSREFLPLIAFTLLIGIGSALYEPAVMGVFTAQPPSVRSRVFALHNFVLNLGVIVGPILGGLVALAGPSLPFLASAVAFTLLGVALFLLGSIFPRPIHQPSLLKNYGLVLNHRPFCLFMLVMMLWWIVYSQLFISFPVRATQLGGDAQWASLLFIANGLTGLTVIFLVMRLLQRIQPTRLLTWGFLISAVGFGAVPLLPSVWWLVVCVVIYTVAETFMLPGGEVQVAAYAGEESGASFFGVYAGAWAAGGSIGNYLGSWLIFQGGDIIPWVVYAGVALVGASAMALHQRFFGDAAAEAQTVLRT